MRACGTCGSQLVGRHAEICYYRLLFFISITVPFIEILVGLILAKSDVVLLDGIHALSHGFFFSIAYAVSRRIHNGAISRRDEKRFRMRYGRIQLACFIIGMSGFLLFEIVNRFSTPPDVHAGFTALGGIIGLGGALLSFATLRELKKWNPVNITSDVVGIHIRSDIWTSIIPIITAALVWIGKQLSIQGVTFLDPAFTSLIALYFIWTSLKYFIAPTEH